MSVKRLFQDSTGDIKQLNGAILNELIYLYNNESEYEDILFMWLKTDKQRWLRIFIDDKCHIDEYLYDESFSDKNESVSPVDYSHWIVNNQIININVVSTKLAEITVTINFTNDKRIIYASNASERCTIQFL